MKISSLYWNGFAYTCKEKHDERLPVGIKSHNLRSFKEGLILLCQGILETRRISHLFSSVLFIFPLSLGF